MDSNLETWFQTAFAEARREWPELDVEEADFRAHVEAKIAKLEGSVGCRKLRTTELYLALACLRQREAALIELEGRYFPRIDRVLVEMRIPSATAEDLKSSLREMLFFGREGSPPLVGDYSGRGDLASWLRSITVRLAFKAKKKQAREVATDTDLENLASETNPELAYLRQAHAAAFESALAEALQGLEPRERNLLRQHYLDGVSLEALAGLYRIHRATVARQIATAREKIVDAVKRTLITKMSVSELESFLRVTRGSLGLRISTHLRAGR